MSCHLISIYCVNTVLCNHSTPNNSSTQIKLHHLYTSPSFRTGHQVINLRAFLALFKVPLNYSLNKHSNGRGKEWVMPATFTCQVLSPYQAGLNITKLVSSRAHDSRQPGAVDAAREFPLPLCLRVLTRNMSSSFHLRHRMWHPQPPAFVTHT